MWLKLHDHNKDAIFINMDTVTCFQRQEGQKRTLLFTISPVGGTSGVFQVYETPEEIMEMMAAKPAS